MNSLSIGQELEIRWQKYCVMGRVHYRQGSFRWVEYDIRADSGIGAWLSAEPSPDGLGSGCELSLHESIPFSEVQFQDAGSTAVWKDTVYERVEQGRAVVTDYHGAGDYDNNEPFSFAEYRSPSGEMLTCEYWVDEEEASVGRKLDPSDLKILETRRRSTVVDETLNSGKNMDMQVFLIVLGVFMFLSEFTTLFDGVTLLFDRVPLIVQQINSQIASQSFSSFKHVTSVSMADGRKGEVYSTSLSEDLACRAVISMDPEHIRYATITAEDGGGVCMVRTSRESVMIYRSKDDVTHVQVVANKNEKREGGTYTSYEASDPLLIARFYNRVRSWERRGQSYPSISIRREYGIDTQRYEPVVSSARQASVSARRSSGGYRRRFGK